jgi:hypothetical protein
MAGSRPLDIERLHEVFKEARRLGVRVWRLVHYAPHVVELLFPAAQYPGISLHDRAIAVEKLTRTAIDCIGGDAGHALAITLCLLPGTLGCTLDERRRLAAAHLGVLQDTWERGWREERLFHDLVMEIYRLHRTNPDPAAYFPAIAPNRALWPVKREPRRL